MVKKKIPSDMAFPLSVSALRERLADVPQQSDIVIDTVYYKGMTPQRQKKTKLPVRNLDGRRVVTAQYQRGEVTTGTPNAWLAENSVMNTFAEPRWNVRIHAIPVAELAAVRSELEQGGYATLVEWLIAMNKKAGSIGLHELVIAFDGKTLSYWRDDRW